MSTTIGRFTSLDPVFLAAGSAEWLIDPQSQNSYAYARNNPINYVDPDGEFGRKLSKILSGRLKQTIFGSIASSIVQNPVESSRIAVSSTPYVGDVIDFKEVVTGMDAFTNKKLTTSERALTTVGAAIPLVGGRVIRTVGSDILKKVGPSWSTIRRTFWKDIAGSQDALTKYGKENYDRMLQGKAPIGQDGYPAELHHKVPRSVGGSNEISNIEPMTRTDHRLGDNYKKNHSELFEN